MPCGGLSGGDKPAKALVFWISLALCFAAASLFSENYVLSHAGHDCPGEDCPVCLLIQRAEHFSRQSKNAVFYPGCSAAIRWTAAPSLCLVGFHVIPLSNVRLKVKMNL
jgi:hypothetical protein